MKLLLQRDEHLPVCTIGKLYVDGVFECRTLEDTVREVDGAPVLRWKIPAKTAIPRGTYPVTITMSGRFKKMLPLLGTVPGFTGVRIHSGNTDADTEGCILVGTSKLVNSIGGSRLAFSKLYEKMRAAIARGEQVSITVK